METPKFGYAGIVAVPNNRSLASYVNLALSQLGNPPKEKIIVCKGEDIPFIVEELSRNGKKIIGLTGRDLFEEYALSRGKTNLKVIKTIHWGDKEALFGKPALCLLGPKGKALKDLPDNLKVCINIKYKNLAKKYLATLNGNRNFSSIYLSGSTESAYTMGMSDLVIDIVYTGSSIREAGLDVYQKIFESDFVIVGVEND